MTEDMRRALDDIRALLMEQFRRETDAAFAALELEMERAARQGGSQVATEAVATVKA